MFACYVAIKNRFGRPSALEATAKTKVRKRAMHVLACREQTNESALSELRVRNCSLFVLWLVCVCAV